MSTDLLSRMPLASFAAVALALVAGSALTPLAAQTVVPLTAKGSFLHVNSDSVVNAVPVALAPLGLLPGTSVRLRVLGDFDQGPGGDVVTDTLGVFSSSATLLGAALLHRVPDAIDAGEDFFTITTFQGNQATDIAEDFFLGTPTSPVVTVLVPAGATHLFLCAYDHYYADNSDPDADYRVELTRVGTWTDLGLGLAGANPAPVLTGSGTLFAGDPISLDLTGAKANSSAALFVGAGAANVPFKGGTLVPTPTIIITGLPTGPAGTLILPAVWPAGLPSGFSLYFQEWIVDATGPAGLTATNGLRATTP